MKEWAEFSKIKKQYNNIYKNINEKLETKNEDLPIFKWININIDHKNQYFKLNMIISILYLKM